MTVLLRWRVLKRLSIDDTEEDCVLHAHFTGCPGDTAHQVSMIVLLGRWSWRGHSSVTLGKTAMHVHYAGLLRGRALWFQGVLLRRLSWNGHWSVTLRKTLHNNCLGLQGESVEFSTEDVFKWSFVDDPGEETLHIHCSALVGQRVLWVSRVTFGRCLKW